MKNEKLNAINPRNLNTDWMSNARYGLMVHFLPGDQYQYIESFDAETFADDCKESGAAYVLFTITQSGYLCVPSAMHDKYTGKDTSGQRDLIMDISNSLEARGIKLCLYFIGCGPKSTPDVARKFGCEGELVGETEDLVITPTAKHIFTRSIKTAAPLQ